MKVFSPASPRNDGRSDGAARPGPRLGLRMLSAAAVAMVIVGLGMLHGPSVTAQTGDDAPSGKGMASRAAFIADIQQTLKADDIRLIALASVVLEDPAVPGRLEDQLERLRIDAMKAEGEFQYATLRREIAEMALKEYVEAILPHDLAAAESELSVAQAAIVEIRNRVGEPRD